MRRLTSRTVLLACVGAVTIALTWRLGGYPLLEPDEGRNAEIMREMAATNDYVLPRLNGLPYLDKPALYFAAGAAAMEIFGPNEQAARLPSLAFTILTVLVVVGLARRLYGTEGAWVAGIATAASPLTIAYARTVIFDAALTCFIVVSLSAFFLAAEPEGTDGGTADTKSTGGWWPVVGWLAAAAGILTKGPVVLVFVLGVALPYAVWRRRPRAVLDPIGGLAFLALVLPWVFAVSRQVPDYLHYVLVVETLQRVATDTLGRGGPFWYFLAIFPAAVLPWSAAAVVGWRRRVLRPADGGYDRRTVFLLLWLAVPLLVFTLSQSKRPQYILPLVPAAALLLARVWHTGDRIPPGARAAGGFLVVLGGLLITRRDAIAGWFDPSATVAAVIPDTAVALGLTAAVAGSLVFAVAEHRAGLLLALALPSCAIPVIGMPLLRAIGEERSSAALAEALEPTLPPDAQVVAIGTFPLSLPFYLRRPLVLATETGAELTSNYVTRHLEIMRRVPASPLRPAGWWREALALCDRPRVFIVPRAGGALRDTLSAHLQLQVETGGLAAYGPCGGGQLAGG